MDKVLYKGAIPDDDGDNIPIISKDSLQTSSNLDGLVMQIVPAPFKLIRRMNGLPCPV